MTLKNYQILASRTAIFKPEIATTYVILKTVGELGELYEKLENKADALEIAKEVGDVAWYLNEFTKMLGSSLEELDSTAKEVRQSSKSLPIPFYMGNLAETVGKGFRDDSIELKHFSLHRQLSIMTMLVNIWIILLEVCDSIDMTISSVLQINIDKLSKRQKENKIHGSGDNR